MSDTKLPFIKSHPDYLSVINEKALLAEKNKQLEEENRRLRHNLALFKKHLFGRKSEKVISAPNLSSKPNAEGAGDRDK